jgi:hypothetical protein
LNPPPHCHYWAIELELLFLSFPVVRDADERGEIMELDLVIGVTGVIA